MAIVARPLHNGLLAATALLATALLAACASGPEINHDINPTASFSAYKSFGFFLTAGHRQSRHESVFTARLKDSTRRAMESKGYVYSESSPDLLLNFYANVQDKQEIRSTPSSMGYYGYRSGYYGGFSTTSIDTYDYKQGTLAIDLIDAQKKILAWQSRAEGRVSDKARKNPGPVIDALVIQMMTTLPAAGSQ